MAVVLTAAMFGWQGYHLAWAHRTASHQPTIALVEAVRTAGEDQMVLVDALEHQWLISDRQPDAELVAGWFDRYAAASAATHAATGAALAGAGRGVARVVAAVESAATTLDRQVDRIVAQLTPSGDRPQAVERLDGGLLDARAAFRDALGSLIAGLAMELDVVTAAERTNEVQSVVVALALFTAAIGAWALFGSRLRRSRMRLATEHEQRVAAEAEAAQLQKMEALGMMADGVAHDMKNLTAIIAGSASEVRRELPGDHPTTAALDRIDAATDQARGVARSLLAFSRKVESPKGAVDLTTLAAGMTQLLRYLVPPPTELVLDAPDAAWVCGDSVQLQQVIFNLAANARDAMPDGGTLTIAIRPARADGPEREWLLAVTDTGEGMAADVERRLFEPFFSTRPAGRGSGLGMTIVDRIVREHRGWIDVDTRPGEGTTFTIGLAAIGDPSPPNSGATLHGPRAHGATVLVAHHDAYVRDLICGALLADGHRTDTASTCADVAAALARPDAVFDVVVIDGSLIGPDATDDECSWGLGRPVIVIGPGRDGGLVPAHEPAITLGEPLSLAAVTEAIDQALRARDRVVRR